MVYVLFLDRYGFPPVYQGVFSSDVLAEQAKARRQKYDEEQFGYANDYVIRPVTLDVGE